MRWLQNIEKYLNKDKHYGYLIGLMTSDGCITHRHFKGIKTLYINFVSKDEELSHLFCECTSIILQRNIHYSKIKNKFYVVNIVSNSLVEHFIKIGINPRKSKTISEINIPQDIFGHFLRGLIDGDGCFTRHQNGNGSYSLRCQIASASPNFLNWLQNEIFIKYNVTSFISKSKNCGLLTLGSISLRKLLPYIYKDSINLCLKRKLNIVKNYEQKIINKL